MISIKKLAITGATAGLLLVSAVPVLAHQPQQGVDIDQTNRANITNNVGTIVTGGRGGAGAVVTVYNTVNKNLAVVGDTCTRCGSQSVDVDQTNKARVSNNVYTTVTSRCGAAGADVLVSNVVNENVAIVGGGHHR